MKTLKALNMITAEKLKEFLNKCLQESVNSLKETSLQPQLSGHPELNYTVGTLLLYAAESATSEDGVKDNIF